MNKLRFVFANSFLELIKEADEVLSTSFIFGTSRVLLRDPFPFKAKYLWGKGGI